MVKTFLDEAYSHPSGRPAETFYDAWAETYDEELAENGYVTPRRCAAALAEATTERSSPILDLGCGTGLSGVALRAAGFTVIDGWDPSAEMLRRAEARNVYRVLRQIEPDQPLSALAGAYAAIFAVGVFSPGLAPPEALDQCLKILPAGGFLCFSFNDHTLKERAYEGRVNEMVDCGAARVVSREYGDHIKARNLGAMVYVLEKA